MVGVDRGGVVVLVGRQAGGEGVEGAGRVAGLRDAVGVQEEGVAGVQVGAGGLWGVRRGGWGREGAQAEGEAGGGGEFADGAGAQDERGRVAAGVRVGASVGRGLDQERGDERLLVAQEAAQPGVEPAAVRPRVGCS